jgi:hypothetical protein
MARKSSPIVQLPLPRTALTPKMIWIWTDPGESTCLWPKKKLSEAEIAHSHWEPKVSDEFFDALNAVSERFWVMDPYFYAKVGLASIWYALQHTSLPEIRVISHEPLPNVWIAERNARAPAKVNIKWKKGFHELHDRFAILDDEAWHFGSTVGGGYHRFGAATRGWDADELARLFINRWES